MTENTTWEQLVTKAGPAGGGGGLGKYEAMLTEGDLKLLDEFVAWLKSTNKVPSANSRASYKSGVAKAKAMPAEKLSSNQRSYLRAFAQFLAAKHPEILKG